ncbi:MAG: hypothetical protein IT219_09880 [Bacteroidales bacterium]|jgi:hypothetical protein|nr:hypothetical protein [Bacteroidales bacterium]
MMMEAELVLMDEFKLYLNSLYWDQALDDLPMDLLEFEYQRMAEAHNGPQSIQVSGLFTATKPTRQKASK